MKIDDQTLNGDRNVRLRDEDVVARIRDIANGTFVPQNSLINFGSQPEVALRRQRFADEIVNDIKIASPCKMDWSKMTGDERKRYCQECKLHVYNVSELSPQETVDLLQKSTTGRVCLRLYRRKDGTVLTRDCPVAVWKLKKTVRRAAALAAGVGAWLGLATPSFAQGAIAGKPAAAGQFVEPGGVVTGGDYLGGATPTAATAVDSEPELGDYTPIGQTAPGQAATTMEVGGVSSVRVNNLETVEKKPNWILLGVSLLGILATLKLLLKKRSSMWIIGGTMVAMFAVLGYAMVAFAM